MKRNFFAAFLALLVSVSPVFADAPVVPDITAPVPTTANKVDGPVTGGLPDKIDLNVWFGGEIVSNVRPVTIRFCMHQNYVFNYMASICSTPDRQLHITGKRQLTGITMTPPVEGEWRWDSDYSLQFTPVHAWPAGKQFQVDMQPSIFPTQVDLHDQHFTISSAPLRASITSMTFFQDENQSDNRGVSTSIQFNTPVAAKDAKEHLSFKLEELSDGDKPEDRKILSAGDNLPFELKMSDDGLEANITTPIASMPDKERFLEANISEGLPAVSGGEALGAPDMSKINPERRMQRVRVPSIYDYAKIDHIDASIVQNDHYVPEQTLVVHANVPFSGKDLTDHLQIYTLPKDKPSAFQGGKPEEDYAWTSANEVTDDILKKAQPAKFTVDGDDMATLHGIKIDVEPGRWVLISVSKGLPFKGGYILGDDHKDTVEAPEYTQEVKIISAGALLSVSGEKKISLYSLGADKINFKVGRVVNDDINHLVSQTEGRFENPNFRNYSFGWSNITETFTKDMNLPSSATDLRKPQFSAFDFTPYMTMRSGEKGALPPKGKGLFYLTVNAMAKDDKGEERAVSTDNRFILVSDLGLVVKTAADNTHDVFIQSIASGKPVAAAEVTVLGINGLPVATVKTDIEGHAVIPSLEGLENEKHPVAYVARSGDDMSFMPYDRRDRGLDYSKFETEGLTTPGAGLRAYMFSDRGVYRPGELAHIGMLVKQEDWSKDLSGVPLQLEVTNPRGQIIFDPLIKLDASGMAEYSFATHDTSPTGTYNVRLYISDDGKQGDELGSTAIRVEEFIPDTLKISSTFNKPAPKGWLTPDGLNAQVDLMHLYGAAAANHRVKASLKIEPGYFNFKAFPDYSFFDALKSDKSYDQPIGEAQTDAQGHATFDLKLAQFGRSTYRLTFNAEGFAQDSGRSVVASGNALVSALPYVIGLKKEGNLGYINKDERRTINLIAVNPSLDHVAVKGLKATITKVTYVSSLIKNERGAYEYRSVAKETPFSTSTIDIAEKGTDYVIDSKEPGSYKLTLSNDDLTLHSIDYSIIGEGNLIDHARKDAVISLQLDKEKYAAGDTMKMNISSPYTGTGLITLEANKVIAFKWFKTKTTETVESIDIPEEFTGKGYVNVQFVRALDAKEIYTDPFAYTVKPFLVDTSSIDSQISLSVPGKVKPGEDLPITYSVKTPGKIIIYGVDEGILQYAHYKTPNPLDFFVNRRALQVATAQILDLLMPEYSLLRAATGGDESGLRDSFGINPFKRKTEAPVVFWSGLIDADTQKRVLHYKVPDYFDGNLHVMAVAASDETVGASETKADVKGDLIVSPNVPVFAAPGDTFTVGLSIANNIQGSGKEAKVKLKVTSSEHLEVTAGGDAEVTVPEGSETKANVQVKVKDVLGGAKLDFTVTSGKSTVTREETLSIRPPLASMTALVSGYVEKGDKTVQQNRALYKEFASADAGVSTLPISLIPGLAEYLDKFPYGCTEQTISKAFPAVTLYGQKDLGGETETVRASVVNTMSRLRELQNSKGGFGYWWYGGEADDFVSVYALHYMTIAKEKHLPVPDEVFRQAQDYVRGVVSGAPASLDDARVQAYGIYILTRGGVLTSNYLPHLLQYLDNNYKDSWKDDLTAVYIAASYKLMQLNPEANDLMKEFTLGDPVYWKSHPFYESDWPFYNSLNRYSQYLTVMSDHFPDMLAQVDRNVLFRVANFIGEGSYNTLSSSYAVMALSSYGQASTSTIGANLTISQQGKSLPLTGELIKRAKLAPDKGDIAFGGGGDYGLFYQVATDGYDRDAATQPIEDGLEISREYLDKDHNPVKEVALGDTVDVVIRMRAHDNKTLSNMALVDLLPGGFEMVPQSKGAPQPQSVEPEAGGDDDEQYTANNDNAPTRRYIHRAARRAKKRAFHPVRNMHTALDAPAQANNDPAAEWLKGDLWSPSAVNARDDRMIAFGTVPSDEVIYHYVIKAVSMGTFTTPPVYIESMYERTVKARGVTGEITVK